MITVPEADKLIQKNITEYSAIDKPLKECYGAVLRENIFADRDIPPANKALKDGVAINWSAWNGGIREFAIQGVQPAGKEMQQLNKEDGCYEIMTGAIVPARCECVIPVEDVSAKDGTVHIDKGLNLSFGQNILRQGSNHKKGDLLLEDGEILDPPKIGVAASVGKSVIKITKSPSIAIISTGDELVEVEHAVRDYQIRKSNSYSLQAILNGAGFHSTELFHLKDNKKELLENISKILKSFDVLVLSGGVSMGKFDFVPNVLNELGVREIFHKIKQRPGKPMWFGKNEGGKLVFGLPGNPISTQICAYRYVVKHLNSALGIKRNRIEYAVLNENYDSDTDFVYFLPVNIYSDLSGQILADPVAISGSADFGSFSKAEGFIELGADQRVFKKGSVHKLYRW